MKVIRKLNQKRRWDACALPPDEVQADALGDLTTSANKLSVFLVETEEQIRRVCAALALSRDHFSNLDYAILPGDLGERLNMALEEAEGETADAEVNRWHCDVVVGTGSGLVQLARWIRNHGQILRLTDARVKEVVREAIGRGHVTLPDRIGPKMQESLRTRAITIPIVS